MRRLIPQDSHGTTYIFPKARIRVGEMNKIMSEIADDYKKYAGKPFAIHTSWGLDGKCYDYYFENHGRMDINIYKRISNTN